MSPSSSAIQKVAFDILCFVLVGIPLFVYNVLDVVPITRQGFFCNDDGIRYPYHTGTVSSAALFVSGFGFLVASAIGVEVFRYSKVDVEKHNAHNSEFHPIVVEIYRVCGYFMIGACANGFFTDIGKNVIGRPRPHFLDVCAPSVACTAANQHLYITNYTCTRTSHPAIPDDEMHHRQEDARKSFPSGHASYSFFSMLFLTLYIELRLRRHLRLTRHLVQIGMLAWAVYVALSRVMDFKHRYSDIAAGTVIGVTVAVFTFVAYRSSMTKSRDTIPARRDENSHQGLIDADNIFAARAYDALQQAPIALVQTPADPPGPTPAGRRTSDIGPTHVDRQPPIPAKNSSLAPKSDIEPTLDDRRASQASNPGQHTSLVMVSEVE